MCFTFSYLFLLSLLLLLLLLLLLSVYEQMRVSIFFTEVFKIF